MDIILTNDMESIDISLNNELISDKSGSRSRRRGRKSSLYLWHLYVYTIAMFCNHFSIGMNFGLMGPSLVDLKYVFNTTMNMISISLVLGNIGYLSGSLFGLLYNYINRQIALVILLLAMAVSTALIPFCPNLWTLYLCQYLIGLGGGAWDTANNVWLIELWPQKSSSALQFSQFMWGLGSVLGPILVKPYLIGENSTHSAQPSDHFLLDISDTTSPVPSDADRRALLKTPFSITGSIQSIIPFVFLIMFFIKRYKSPNERKLKRKDSTESLISSSEETLVDSIRTNDSIGDTFSRRKRILVIALFSLLLAIYSSLEIAHFSYSSTYYQFIPLRITAQKAAEIVSVMSTSYTIGRCVSAFVALRIGPQTMIVYHLVIIIVGMAVLYYGQQLIAFIWIGNIILGFGFSAMYPAIIALTAKYINLTDTVSTVMVFTNGVCSAITPFLLGPLIETNPFVFIVTELVYLTLSALLFLTILTVIQRNGSSASFVDSHSD